MKALITFPGDQHLSVERADVGPLLAQPWKRHGATATPVTARDTSIPIPIF